MRSRGPNTSGGVQIFHAWAEIFVPRVHIFRNICSGGTKLGGSKFVETDPHRLLHTQFVWSQRVTDRGQKDPRGPAGVRGYSDSPDRMTPGHCILRTEWLPRTNDSPRDGDAWTVALALVILSHERTLVSYPALSTPGEIACSMHPGALRRGAYCKRSPQE